VRKLIAVLVLILGACRGEPIPRDYQNNPPAMTDPVDSKEEAPDPQSSTTVPEPSYGAEGTTGPYEPTRPDVDPGKPVANPTTTSP
jgi:hypothetical protein